MKLNILSDLHAGFSALDTPLNDADVVILGGDVAPLRQAARPCACISPSSTCSHDSFDYVLNGTRVICNPRGYAKAGTNENARFDPDFTIEV